MKKITEKEIRNFKIHLINEEKSEATVEKYLRDVKAFKKWLNCELLSKERVIEYKEVLKKSYAKSSVNSILASLNCFFDYFNLYELKVKSLKIQKQIFKSKEKELTREEYIRLLRTARKKGQTKLYLLMETLCSCGIRISELRFITKEAIKLGRADIECKGKARSVIIPNGLCKILKKYAKEKNIKSGAIFITKSGKPLDRSNIWKLMKALCEEAGVENGKVFPHNLRHLFARTYYSVEKDIVRLADILGHSSINTTRIYTMESGETHRKQIEKLNLLL